MQFEISDVVQFFLLPLVLGTSLLSMGFSNTLYAAAFGWYFYITHLGYRGEIISFLPFIDSMRLWADKIYSGNIEMTIHR